MSAYPLPRGILAALPEAVLKAIYGDQYRNFMGIQDEGSGVQEIQNSAEDYSRAYTAEGIIYRLVDIRTKAIGQAPLKVFATDHRGKQTAVDHDALGVIKFGNPQGWVAGESAFKKATLASLDLHGHIAAELSFTNGGIPSEIYWLPPEGYEPIGNDAGFFMGVKQKGSAGQPQRQIAASKLFYHHTLNLQKPWLGTSKIAAARTQINLNMNSLSSNTAFFKQGMQGHLLMTGDWDNTTQNVTLIQRALRKFRGSANAHQTIVVGKNTKISPLSVNPKDAEWVMQQKLSLEALCAIFGVPLPMYGNLDNGTYANYDQAHSTFWTDTMKGDLDDLADGLTRNFLSRWPDSKGLAFGFDYNQIRGLSEDINKIWERFMQFMDRIDKQVVQRVLVPDQARAIIAAFADQLGIDSSPWNGKVPGGNNFYVPYMNVPIDQLDIQAVIDIMAARGSNPQLEEDVPGAPHAAENAQKPAPRQAASASWTPRVIKTPHPIPIRDNRLAPIQERGSRRFKRFFQDQQTAALRALRNEKSLNLKDNAPNLNEPLWDKDEALKAIEDITREMVSDSASAAYSATSDDYGLSVVWDESNPFLDNYIGSRLKFIRGIDDTTISQIRDALTEGYQQGESMDGLAERVKSVFREAIDNRSRTIARTETIQAYGHASIEAYKQAGLERAQVYDGSGDPACAAVNGMVVSLDEAAELMGDEHPNGTRGVAPYVGVLPQAAAAQLPAPATASKAQLAAINDLLVAVAEQRVTKDAQHRDELTEVLKTLKAMAEHQTVVSSPPVHVKVAPADVVFPEGMIQVNVEPPDLIIEEGAIQSTTNVQAPNEGDVDIEYDNYGETGKPIRIRRR